MVFGGARGVKLESFSIGGRRYTTLEAFVRFVEATTAAAAGDAPSPCTMQARPQPALR